MKSFKVLFLPDKREVEVVANTSLLEAGEKGGIYLNSLCGGEGVCGKCRVRVVKGKVKLDKNSVPFFTREEIEKLFSETPSYYIDPEKCQACTICAQRCPVDAIDGGKNKIHIINQETCIRCGTCYDSCPPKFSAIKKLVGEAVPPPVPEEKRFITRK